jgi:hypothetical protein
VGPSSIALQGLQQADVQLTAAATKIASADASSRDAANLDVADLSAEMVALMSAQTAFGVNLAPLKTVDEMQTSLLDLKLEVHQTWQAFSATMGCPALHPHAF